MTIACWPLASGVKNEMTKEKKNVIEEVILFLRKGRKHLGKRRKCSGYQKFWFVVKG